MSTTIYNGYQLKPMSMLKLSRFIKQFREETELIASDLISKVLAAHISEMIDDMLFLDEVTFIKRHVLYPKESDKLYEQMKLEEKGVVLEEKERIKLTLEAYPYRSAFSVVYRKAEQRYVQIGRTDYRDPEIDVDCMVSIFPIKRKFFGRISLGSKLIAIFHTEQKEYEKHWNALNEVSYYGYWNNTDPEEGVSDRAWKKRKLDWDEAIPGYMIKDAFRVDIIKGFPNRENITPETVLPYIPSLEERSKRVAYDLLSDRKFSEYMIDNNVGEDAIGVHNQVRRWLRTDEGKHLLEEETKRIIPLLPEITKHHFITKLHELYQDVVEVIEA
jgi:hypothetical protein